MQGTPRALHHRQFRRYLLARITSSFGSGVAALALTFGVLGSGASAAVLGLVLAASTVPQIGLTLLGGVIGDRFDRRRLLIATDLVQAGSQLLIGLLFLQGQAAVWAIVALRIVFGGATAFHRPAANGIIVDVVGADAMQEARSLLSIGTSTAKLSAPAVGALLVALLSPGWALILDAVTYLVSAAALARISVPLRALDLNSTLRSDFVHGWREFTSRPWAVKMIASFMLYQATALPAVFVLGPIHADAAWGGAASWALVMTGLAIGDILGGLLTLRWRPRRLLLAANLTWALDLPLLLILGFQLDSEVLAIPAATLFGVGISVGGTLWFQALASHVPPESLARVTSYDEVGSIALNPLGYVAIGAVAAAQGAGATFAVVVLAHVLMLGWLLADRGVNAIERVSPATG